MPRLPAPEDYGLSTPRPSRGVTEISPVQVRPDLATGKAMQDIGALMQQEAEKLDETVALDALNQLQNKKLELTYGDNGFSKIQGKGVIDGKITNTFPAQLQNEITRLEGTIGSQGAKLKFQTQASGLLRQFKAGVYTHAAKETETFNIATDNAQVETARTMAFNGDLKGAEAYASQALARVIARQGLEGEAATEAARKAMGPVYAAAIDGALKAGKSGEALAIFEASKGAMTEAQIEKYSNQIKTKNDYVRGLEISAQVKGEGLSGSKAVARIQELAAGNKEMAENARIDFEHKVALDKVDLQNTLGEVEKVFQDGGFSYKSMQQAMQTDAFTKLPLHEQAKIRKQMKAEAEHTITFGQHQQAYWDARRLENPERMAEYMALLDNPTALMAYTDGQILTMREAYGREAVTRLLALKHQTKTHADKFSIPKDFVEAAMPPEIRKPKTPVDTLRRDRFEVIVKESLKDWQLANPGAIPDETAQKTILESAGAKVTATNRWLPGSDQYPAYQFKPPTTEFEAAAQKIVQEKKGRRATPAEVQDLWRQQPESRIK